MSNANSYMVADYMRTDVITLTPSASLREAVSLMLEKHTNGLVVTDESKKILGILSSWDIIQFIVPDYLEEDKHLASFESGDMFAKRVQELQNHPISEFMSTNVRACHQDHALMEAATMLSEFRIRQLPVIDKNGILVGYINRTDIKRAMGNALGLSK